MPDFKRIGTNVGRIAVDIRMISGLVLGALGMFGVDVNENTSFTQKVNTLELKANEYKAQADKYRKLYEEIMKEASGGKKILTNSKKSLDEVKENFKNILD